MSVNPIKGKFIKISNEEAFKGAKLDGSDKEILKVNSSDQVILLDLPIVDDGVSPASNVATEAYVDAEVTGLSDSINQRIDDHVGGFAEEHSASNIIFVPAGLTTSIDVQSAIEEVQIDATQGISNAAAAQSAINNHLSDSVDAHDASAISVSPIVGLVATDVQAALSEIQGSLGGLSFEASAISSIPAGNLAATDVQAALNELDTEKVAKAGDSMQGQLTMESADILVDYSTGGNTDQVLIQQGDILVQNYDGAGSGQSSDISSGNIEMNQTDVTGTNLDSTMTMSVTGGPLIQANRADYANDNSGAVQLNPESIYFQSQDNPTGNTSQATYASGSFGFQNNDGATGNYVALQADNLGVSLISVDVGTSIISAILPTFDFQLTPKKYVDDADAVIAGSISSHLSDSVDAHDASAISSIPAGNLAATDVQAALNELDSEKVKKSGDTMSGLLDITVAGAAALEANDILIGNPWGAGYSVITPKDGSTDQMYIQSADQLGAFAGVSSKVMVVGSGYAQGAATGDISILTGNALVSGATGNALVSSGTTPSGNSGYVIALSGSTTAGNSGIASLRSGTVTTGNSGNATAFSGNVATGNSGLVQLNSGAISVSGASGAANVFSGPVNAGTGVSGAAQLSTGGTAGGASGLATLFSGTVTNATATSSSGNIIIRSGDNTGLGLASTLATGAARMRSGSISNASAVGETGISELYSGNNAGSGKTGDVSVYTGNNTGTGISGDLALRTGTTASGTRGKVAITSRIVEINSQLDMQSNKIIDMAAGSASGDAVEYSQYTTALGLKANKNLDNLVVAPLGAYRFLSSVNMINGFNEIKSENVTGSSNSGAMAVKSGDAISGNSGAVMLVSGDSVSGTAGNVVIASGVGVGSVRGIVSVEASSLSLLNVIDMNSHQINELADGTLAADAVNKGQLDAGLALKLSLTGGTMSGDIDMQNNKILHLTMNSDQDCAATKQYVDNVAEGLHVHAPVRAVRATQIVGTYDNGVAGVGATITPTAAVSNIDGIGSFATTQRIIVNGQSNTWENGVYVVSAVNGSSHITLLTRASDFDTATEVAGGDFIFVQEGSTYTNTGWVETDKTTALGFGVSDPILFLQFSGAGSYTAGDGLNLTGTVFSVDVTDLVGFGIGHDSFNNFRIASEAAGDGLAGGDGVALSVDHDGLGLEFIGGQLSLAIDASMLDKASGDLKLADTTVTAGSYASSASMTASFTVDAQGRLTAASDQGINITASQVSDFTSEAQASISVSDSSTINMSYLAGDISADVIFENSTLQVGVGGLAVYHDSSLSHGAGGLAIADVGVTAAKIAYDVAGAGLFKEFTGALAVSTDNLSLEVFADNVQVKDLGISEAKLADLSVSTGKIQDDAVDKSKINADVAGAGLGQYLDGSLKVNVDDSTIEIDADNIRVKDLGISEAKLAALSVSTGKIQDDAVDKSKIASDVAGDGLGQAVDGSLKVNVDDSTIEIFADSLLVKNLGITEIKLAALSVSTAKIQDDAVDKSKINADVAGDGLGQAVDGSLKVNIGDGLELATDAVQIKLDGSSLSVSGSGLKSNIIWHKELYAISTSLSTGAFFDLDFVAEVDSISAFVDRLAIHEGASEDYSVSYTGGASGVTRITFLNSLVTAGQQRLSSGDTVYFKYQRKAA